MITRNGTARGLRQTAWHWGLLLLAWVVGESGVRGAAIPEPDTVIYGRVFHRNHIYELPVTEGVLEWTIRLDEGGSRTLTLKTELESFAGGAYSYRLKVPHEAFVAGFSENDLGAGVLPLGAEDTRFRHHEIRINGIPARILPPGRETFDASQGRRLSTYRLDLAAVLENPDSDKDGMPDWWENRFRLDKFTDDASGDPDGDGLTNLAEFRLGSDPSLADHAPKIVWENTALDEGTTEIVTFQAIDADTAPDRLVYTLTEAPVGGQFLLLFGATAPGPDGRFGDRPLRAGDTFTQAQVDSGVLALKHTDLTRSELKFRLRLSDGDPAHAAYETALAVHVHRPSAEDGTGAALWYDAPFESVRSTNTALTQLTDRSGSKPWLDGVSRPFHAASGYHPVGLTNQGPMGQPVLAFNIPGNPLPPPPAGQPAGQYFLPPSPQKARVFHEGERTVFALVKTVADGTHRSQIVNGSHFQVSFTGAINHGRDNQIRFATDNQGAVYGNHEIREQWVLVTAWEESGLMTVELNGTGSGGPHPQRETTEFGSLPVIGGKHIARYDAGLGRDVVTMEEPFEGYLGELMVFNRSLNDVERERINYQLLSKWFGWVMLDGSEEFRDLTWRVASSALSVEEYKSSFVPKFGADRRYILLGGAGQDRLEGGHNDDILVGELGVDRMTGHGGRDVFVFNHADQDGTQDVITDFRPHQEHDAIDLNDMLRGESRLLRDYVRIRTDGQHSYLEIDHLGERQYDDHTIVLENVVLRDEDLYSLWARTNLITGDKRFPLPVTLTATTPQGVEISRDAAFFTLHFGGQSVPEGLEIPFELFGNAERDRDYRLSVRAYHEETDTYSWDPVVGHELFVREKVGDLDFVIRVEPIQDDTAEGLETVRLHLTPVPEMFDLAVAEAEVSIIDGPQRVNLAVEKTVATEAGDPGVFVLRREGSSDVPLDVRVRTAGPAQNGVDYQFIPSVVHFDPGQMRVTVSVLPYADEVREIAEAVELIVESDAAYTVSASAQAATVMIENAAAVLSVETIEPLAIVQDGRPGAFLIRREGAVNESLVVLLEVGGTATANRDYQRMDRFVTFAPGVTSMPLLVRSLPDATLTGGAETVTLTLIPDAAYSVRSGSTGEVRIIAASTDIAHWKESHFPGNTNSTGVFAGLDSDGDGLSNVLEYAFGLDPKAADRDRTSLPSVLVLDGLLAVRFTRPLGVVDVDYVVEASNDLRTWTPATGFRERTSVLISGGREQVTVVDPQALGVSPWRFARIAVRLK